jgi:hypothetical protein
LLGGLSRHEQRQLHALLGKLKLGLRAAATGTADDAVPVAPAARRAPRAKSAPPRPRRALAAGARAASRATAPAAPIARFRNKVRP